MNGDKCKNNLCELCNKIVLEKEETITLRKAILIIRDPLIGFFDTDGNITIKRDPDNYSHQFQVDLILDDNTKHNFDEEVYIYKENENIRIVKKDNHNNSNNEFSGIELNIYDSLIIGTDKTLENSNDASLNKTLLDNDIQPYLVSDNIIIRYDIEKIIEDPIAVIEDFENYISSNHKLMFD